MSLNTEGNAAVAAAAADGDDVQGQEKPNKRAKGGTEWYELQDLDKDPELEIRDRVLKDLGFIECTSSMKPQGIKLKYLQERIIRDVKINPLLGRKDGSVSLRIIRNMTIELDKLYPDRYRFEILVRNKRN